MKIYIRLLLLTICLLPVSMSTAKECAIEQRTFKIDNISSSYAVSGEGPTILLLHGLFANKQQWQKIMCQLADAGYHIIAPDLPGYGSSAGFTINDYALERQVKILQQFLKQQDIDQIHIAGSSMGGTIAALFAENNPDSTLTLAFLGAPLGIVHYNAPLKQAILEGFNPFIPIDEDQFSMEMELLFNKPPKIPAEIIASKVADYKKNNTHYVQVWNIVNLYTDILQRPSSFDKPVFIAWGQEDKIFAINDGKQKLANAFAQSSAVSIEQAGHLPQYDQATKLAERYLAFLAE